MRGHIRKRGRNSFELKFELDRVDGRRRIAYRNFKGSKREAQAELTRLLAQMQTGGYVDPDKLTVIEHVRNRVALWRGNDTISARTAQGCQRPRRTLVWWHPEDVTSRAVSAFRARAFLRRHY